MTPSDDDNPGLNGRSSPGRDLFYSLLAFVNDVTISGSLTGRIVDAGEAFDVVIVIRQGQVQNVRTVGASRVLPRVIAAGRKNVDKKINGRPDSVKEDALALKTFLEGDRILSAHDISAHVERFVFRSIVSLVFSAAPEAQVQRDDGEGEGGFGIDLDRCLRNVFEEGFRRGLLESVSPPPDQVIGATAGRWREMPGTSAEACRAMFDLIDGLRTMGQLIQDSGRHEAEVRYVTARLDAAGCLQAPASNDFFKAAEKARREGRLDIALQFYRKAESEGNDARAALEMARLFEVMGRTEDASEAFSRYVELCEKTGSLDEAIRHCERTLATNPDDGPARRRLADLRMRAGRVEDAVSVFRDMATKEAASGNWTAAAESCRKLVENDQADGAIYDRYFDAIAHQTDAKAAAGDLRFLKTHFLSRRDIDRSLRAAEGLRDRGVARPEERWEHANILIEAGRPDDALTELEVVSAKLSERNPAVGGLDWELLTGIYELMVKLRPNHAGARGALARSYGEAGHREKAVEHYEAYLDAIGEDGDPNEIASSCEELLALDPRNVRAAIAMASAHLNQDEPERAISLLSSHAEAAVAREDLVMARRAFEAILEIDPFHLPANEGMHDVARRTKDREMSVRYLKQVAGIRLHERLFEKAEETYRELIELCPMELAFYRELIDLYEVRSHRSDRDGKKRLSLLEAYGDAAIRGRNFGIAEEAVRRIRRLDPASAVATRLDADLSNALRLVETRSILASGAASGRTEAAASGASKGASTGSASSAAAVADPEFDSAADSGGSDDTAVATAEEPHYPASGEKPADDPFSNPPVTISAESFSKILDSLKHLAPSKEAEDGDSADEADDSGDEAGESELHAEETEDAGESEDAPSEEAEAAAETDGETEAAGETARPAAPETTPLPPQGDVEFSSILQSLKNLKLK